MSQEERPKFSAPIVGIPQDSKDLTIMFPPAPKRRPSGVAPTLAEMAAGNWGQGRVSQAQAFIKRAKKSDAKRKAEKASRKRNRRKR